MSRLGDLLLTERTRKKMTRKQVSKLGGISEGFLKDVEEGRKIIQDDLARRILLKMGVSQEQETSFTLDEIAAAVDLGTVSPAPVRAPESTKKKPEEKRLVATSSSEDEKGSGPSGVWLDALASVLKPVPVMNAGWIQIGRKMMPIENGKIENANPDKVVWFKAPDSSMHSLRIEKDDLVLVVSQTIPVDNAVMLIEYGAHRCLRKIKLLGNSQILIQSGDREMQAEALHVNDIKFVGRAVRVEFDL